MDLLPAFSAPEGAVDRYDDVELLVRIADRERDETDAETAFTIFFQRHAEFLRLACRKFKYHRSFLEDKDIVMRVMSEIYKGKAVFSPPADVTDPEKVRQALRGWLIIVARNLFHGEMRKLHFQKNLVALDAEAGQAVTPPICESEDELPPPPADRTRILRFRDALSAEDQLIFDRSIDYYDRAFRTFNVPPAVAQAIAAEVDLEIATVRKRRERMMAKLREALAAEAD